MPTPESGLGRVTSDDNHLEQIIESFSNDAHNIMSEVLRLIHQQFTKSSLKLPLFQVLSMALT